MPTLRFQNPEVVFGHQSACRRWRAWLNWMLCNEGLNNWTGGGREGGQSDTKLRIITTWGWLEAVCFVTRSPRLPSPVHIHHIFFFIIWPFFSLYEQIEPIDCLVDLSSFSASQLVPSVPYAYVCVFRATTPSGSRPIAIGLRNANPPVTRWRWTNEWGCWLVFFIRDRAAAVWRTTMDGCFATWHSSSSVLIGRVVVVVAAGIPASIPPRPESRNAN